MLLPLLEQVVSKKEEPEDEQETNDLVGPELTSSRNAQGMLIPLGKSSGEDLGGRGVAAWVTGGNPAAMWVLRGASWCLLWAGEVLPGAPRVMG